MAVPILLSGEKAGELEIRREGLYTVFEGRLPATVELTRLWVAGGRQSAYLGLMEPKGSEQVLRRRLTAAEMRKLPTPIEYACTQEPVPEAPSAERLPPPEETGEGAAQEESVEQPRPVATGPPAATEKYAGETAEDEGLLWFSRPDGSLVSFDGRCRLLALPARLRQVPPGLRLLRIGDREYLVFRT